MTSIAASWLLDALRLLIMLLTQLITVYKPVEVYCMYEQLYMSLLPP